MRLAASPAGWLTGLCVAAVLAVNVAGIVEIAFTRRGARDEAARLFRLETAARAGSIESALSSSRADLAFLTGSSAISRLEGVDRGAESVDAAATRSLVAAEAALLVFLHGHLEVKRLVVMKGKDRLFIETGRRGGVPILWLSEGNVESQLNENPRAAAYPAVRRVFAFEQEEPAYPSVQLLAEIDPAIFLERALPRTAGMPVCSLWDASGRPLTGQSAEAAAPAEPASLADAPVHANGWSVPSPWRLACAQHADAAVSLLEPLAARSRMTLVFNLAVMLLTLLLASFAIHQMRRRAQLEAQALEEARVRELERQLFHAERLSTVGRLAAGMAHEINNPLEGMANYVALARDHLARGELGAAETSLEGVREGLDRAAGIVRLALVHAEPATVSLLSVELNETVKRTVDFVRSRREFHDLAFDIELPDEPLIASGSPVLLGQVLMNLVVNACEAQSGGGEVRVSARRTGAEIRIEIADRGPGVPEENRARIFEPFFSTKESTGLGLSISHSIVTQHGGRLEVDSRAGGGAVFTLRLPAAGRDDKEERSNA